MSIVPLETLIKTHVESMLGRVVQISGFKMIERRVIEAVERSPHQEPDAGPDSMFRGPKK